MKTICCVELTEQEWEDFIKSIFKKGTSIKDITYAVFLPMIVPGYRLSTNLIGTSAFFGEYLNKNIHDKGKCRKHLKELSNELEVVDFTNPHYDKFPGMPPTLITPYTLTPYPGYEESYELLKNALLSIVNSIEKLRVEDYEHTQIDIPIADFKASHVCLRWRKSSPTELFPAFRATFRVQNTAITANTFTKELDGKEFKLNIQNNMVLNVIGTPAELTMYAHRFVGNLIL